MQLLERIFWQRQKASGLDLEAVEMAVRSAVHEAGATALTQLLQFDPPGPNQRQLPCPCGHWAKYFGLRCKPVLTAVGEARCLRPYYLCPHCHQGQFPWMSILTSSTRNYPRVYAVCWPPWAMKLPSIGGESK